MRLGALDNQKGLDYGVAELPSHNSIKSNFASYWVNGITTKATGPKRDAAVKFLKFITTPEAMELWMNTVGELPARKSVAEKDANKNHAKYGPFSRRPSSAERRRPTVPRFQHEPCSRFRCGDGAVVATATPAYALQDGAVGDQMSQSLISQPHEGEVPGATA